MSVSSILKKLYPMDREKRYPMDLNKRRKRTLSVCSESTIGIKNDGTCLIAGRDWYPSSLKSWNNVVSVSVTSSRVAAGVLADGSCCANGPGTFPNGLIVPIPNAIGNLKDVVDVKLADWGCAYVLKKDGTCLYMLGSGNTGSVSTTQIPDLQDAIAISVSNYDTMVALKSDGTLKGYGSSLPNGYETLTNLVDVSLAGGCIIGLKEDGTCVAAGQNRDGKLDVTDWTDIVAIDAGVCFSVGLKSDGTCVATEYITKYFPAINEWTDIVAIAASNAVHVVGLKSDGTCVALGNTQWGQCDLADWHLMQYFRQGLLTSKTPVNLLDKTSVSGFTVKGIEPANTKRRVAFKVEDKWNKLSAEGALTPLATQEITADSVLEEGNTVAELEAITTTTGLAGKLIYPAVALYADPEAEVMPTFGMTVKAEIDTTVNVYSYTGYSQEYSLSAGEDVQVVNVAAETETTGEGNVVVTARLKQGGEWTDYMALSDTAMKQASALQLKAVYTVTNTDGSQSAKVKNVTIRYTTSGATVNGVPTDIVTKTQRFTNDLVYAHCYVKHKKLQDAVIDAYCSLRKRPKSKSMYQFGNGTGALNTYKLPDAGINQDTLSVYVDGKTVYDFGYNTETSEITLTADKDTALSASYECGWEMSEWIKMVQGVSQVNDSGGYTTEYSYTVPTHEGYEYTVTAIKYSLVRPEGTVTKETIGVGTGKRQMIELPHFAKKETIVCNGAWSYDYDRKLLTIIAPEGEDIVISYDWIAETPTVYAISAGWAD